jgi:hypothetical protein
MLEKSFKPNHLAKQNRKNGQNQRKVVFSTVWGHYGTSELGSKGTVRRSTGGQDTYRFKKKHHTKTSSQV